MGKKKSRDHSSSREDKENRKLFGKMKKMMSEMDRRLRECDRSSSRKSRKYSRDRRARRDASERRRGYHDRERSSDDRSRSRHSDSRSHRSLSNPRQAASRSRSSSLRSRYSRGSYNSDIRSRHSSQESKGQRERQIKASRVSNEGRPSVEREGRVPTPTVSPPAAPPTAAQPLSTPSTELNVEKPIAPVSEAQEKPEHEIDLQEDILNIMGPRLETDKQKAAALHKDVVIRWTEIFRQGLPKEENKKLIEKYKIPENCGFIAAPKLNPEVISAVQENVKSRDKRISEKQERIASCLAAVGKAITIGLKTDSSVKLELLEILSDVGRLLAFLQREESEIRKSLILANLNASLKDILSNSTFDGLLFGDNLEEKIKTAKTLERTSKDLKPPNNPWKPKISKNQRGPPTQRQSMYARNPQTSSGLRKTTPSSSKDSNSRPRKPHPRKPQQSYRRR